MSGDVMREVERKARSWWFLHQGKGGHDNRHHPLCPWCLVRAERNSHTELEGMSR